MAKEPLRVFGGVDTHKDFHVAAVVDERGKILNTAIFDANARGYATLRRWPESFGTLERVGVEGTGSYGVGLARYLQDNRVEVVEVNRPNRQMRRQRGKADPVDAEAAARAALNGETTVVPKDHDDIVESIRVLRVAFCSARDTWTRLALQIRDLIVSAPASPRESLPARTVDRVVHCVEVPSGRCPQSPRGHPTGAQDAVASLRGFERRDGRPDETARRADQRGEPGAARGQGGGRRRGLDPARRRGIQLPASAQGVGLRFDVRGLSDPCLVGSDQPSSPQPIGGPTGERRAVAHCHGGDDQRRGDQDLPGPAQRAGHDQARCHTLFEAPYRPRGFSPAPASRLQGSQSRTSHDENLSAHLCRPCRTTSASGPPGFHASSEDSSTMTVERSPRVIV